ncbi:MAG: PadR family transcriptional regulator [Alphaproteobacteria bacterium]|nr:PadR family transcriptional regulator [Alphaproteobacteria bacterium]
MDVRTLCLGLLTRSEASGYEIKKAFQSGLSHFYDASFGSIYPALSRLTEEGLVTCKEEPQDKRPDKKVYRITPAGRLAFIDALGRPPGHDRIRSDFLATILFADLLSPRQIAGLIDGRLTETRSLLAELREQAKEETRAAGDRFVIAYGIAVLEAEVTFLEERRHVIEGAALLGRAPGSAAAD